MAKVSVCIAVPSGDARRQSEFLEFEREMLYGADIEPIQSFRSVSSHCLRDIKVTVDVCNVSSP